MPSRDESIATEAKMRAVLASGAEARLRSIPGVTHVSVGVKERNDRSAGTMGIRVYVREKRPLDQLLPNERIPAEIGGVPTDVIVSRVFRHTLDVSRYRPVEGGAIITTRIIGVDDKKPDTTGMRFGTLGCTATLNSDGSPLLLTNCHVLMAFGAKKGDNVYQPGPTSWDPVPVADAPVRPHDDTDMIAKIVDGKITPRVDAAIARLDVSSCCHCCGIEYRDEIIGLSEDGMPASNKIVGLRAAVSNTTVYKVGAASGRTSGTVMDTTGDPIEVTFNGKDTTLIDQIYIAGDVELFTFSNQGDSGSAIIDEDGYIVGLLFASTDDPPPAFRAAANHIEDVQAALGITINLSRSTPSSGARLEAQRVTYPEIRGGREIYARARAQLMSDPAGAWLWKLAEEHREEIVRLVTTHRPVTVAWRRAGGPTFFAAGLNTIREGGSDLPGPVNGLSLEAALDRLGQSLAAHGSEELRAAIAEHRVAILQAVRNSTTMGEMLEKLGAVLA